MNKIYLYIFFIVILIFGVFLAYKQNLFSGIHTSNTDRIDLDEGENHPLNFILKNEKLDDKTKNEPIVKETAELYRISQLLQTDREQAIAEYYKFYRNPEHSNRNRAYAVLMAGQNTIANADTNKLLIFLPESEVREMKSLEEREILYHIDKVIYTLFPFPLSASRIATYEAKQTDDISQKKKIFDKYMFKWFDNVQSFEKNPGLSHLIANSYGSLSQLYSHLEDYKIVTPASTTEVFEVGYNKSVVFSALITQQFLLLSFLDHEIKTNNNENIEKIFSIIENTGKLDPLLKKRLNDETSFKKYYPYLYKKISENKSTRDRLLSL